MADLPYINHNGKLLQRNAAGIPLDNGAFRYGFGLFETMLVKDGTLQLARYHMERLFDGMETLSLRHPALLTEDRLQALVLETVKKNNSLPLCRVRLQVYAGSGGMFGSEADRPGFVIECFDLNPEAIAWNENGLVLGIAEQLFKSPDMLANLKSCNALVYAASARQARENKWNDALICNTNGNIIESTIANIFWVKDGDIYTPPLSEGCVAGVMRRHLLTTHNIHEAPLSVDTLLNADEVFLSNAIRGIRWVGNIGNKSYANTISHPLAGKLSL